MDYSELLKEFKEWVTTDSKCQSLWKKAIENRANYQDANNYSARVSRWWSDKLKANYAGIDYERVSQDIANSLSKAYSESAYYSKTVQNGINRDAKIGMKAIEPKLDETRISNLISKLVDEDATFLLSDRVVENIGKQAISDTIKANARIQDKAGLKTMIIRHVGANGCCEWCQSIAGAYEYGEQDDEVFMFHDNCGCWVEYKVSKNNIQRQARNTDHIKTTVY